MRVTDLLGLIAQTCVESSVNPRLVWDDQNLHVPYYYTKAGQKKVGIRLNGVGIAYRKCGLFDEKRMDKTLLIMSNKHLFLSELKADNPIQRILRVGKIKKEARPILLAARHLQALGRSIEPSWDQHNIKQASRYLKNKTNFTTDGLKLDPKMTRVEWASEILERI